VTLGASCSTLVDPMDDPLDTDVAIEAPEHIVFRHAVAGPGRRAFARVIDLCVCYGAVVILTCLLILAFVGFAGFGSAFETISGAGVGLILVIFFAAEWLYSFLWEGLTGRSPGKIALGLRVVMVSGRPIGLGAAALRNVLRAADVLPGAYLVGVTAMALTRRFQRLGDLVAGTMVIITGRPSKAAPLVLWPPAAPVELAVLPDSVPLDVDERVAIELFLRRRPTLGPAREQELADILMVPLQRRFGFRLPDASRTLAILYDRAVNAGRGEGPPSSRGDPAGWLSSAPPAERRG
jgi:uncharacterized RDD family membrane protein YckC